MGLSLQFPHLSYSHIQDTAVSKKNFAPHNHTWFEILYVFRGTGTFLIENKKYNFSDHALFLVPPNKYHVLQTPPAAEYERCVISFSEEILPPALPRNAACFLQADENIVSLIGKFEGYAARFKGDYLRLLFSNFLTELIILVTEDSQNGGDYDEVPEPVRQALDYIRDHVCEPLSAKEIAEHVYLSESYLSHASSRAMHTSMMTYARRKKMFEAYSLLLKGTPPTRISQMLGYENYSTFLRCYKKEFGKLPSSLT